MILNLHRVASADRSAYRPMSPLLFEELVVFVFRYFRVTTFSNLDFCYRKAQLILSFDDGYADFFENALPVLRRHKISANQNIIPACVETGLPPINVLAQDFVGNAPKDLLKQLDVPGFSGVINFKSAKLLSSYIKFLPSIQRTTLRPYLIEQFFKWSEFKPTRMMSITQINDSKELVEFGAHSFNHDSLSTESDNYVHDDAIKCKLWFKNRINLDPYIYALPNGSHKHHQLNIIRNAGYSYILLANNGINNLSSITTGLFDRVTFDARSQSELTYRAVGGLSPVPK